MVFHSALRSFLSTSLEILNWALRSDVNCCDEDFCQWSRIPFRTVGSECGDRPLVVRNCKCFIELCANIWHQLPTAARNNWYLYCKKRKRDNRIFLFTSFAGGCRIYRASITGSSFSSNSGPQSIYFVAKSATFCHPIESLEQWVYQPLFEISKSKSKVD